VVQFRGPGRVAYLLRAARPSEEFNTLRIA
jgi:hypothetical protein